MKYIKTFIAILLFIPSIVSAAFGVGWNATSTATPWVSPLKVGGQFPAVRASSFIATSTTATSTFPIASISDIIYGSQGVPTFVTSITHANMGGTGWVFVSDNIAYVISDQFGAGSLTLFDVTDPTKPRFLSQNTDSRLNGAEGLELVGKTLYITAADYLLIFDVNDSTNPTIISAYNNTVALECPEDMVIVGNIIYIANGFACTGGIASIDITDPYNPYLIQYLTSGSINYPTVLRKKGDYLFVSSQLFSSQTFISIDITNPRNMQLLDTISGGIGFEINGSYAYFTSLYSSTGRVIDISDPADLRQVNTFTLPSSATVIPKVANGYLYMTDYSDASLAVYTLASSTNPVYIGKTAGASGADDLFINGNYAYVTNNSSPYGISIYKLNGASFPTGQFGSIKANFIDTLSFNTGDLIAYNTVLVGRGGIFTEGAITSSTTYSRQFVGTSTATSTSKGGWDISGGCYAISGTCITGGGSGTNYWTNSGVTTTLNTGSVASAGTFNATSTTASVFPYASTTAISASGNGYFAGTIQAGSSAVPISNSGWFQSGLGTDNNQSFRGKLTSNTVVDLMKVNSSNQTSFQSASSGFVWRNAAGNTTRMTLTDAGSLGIGTTTPGTLLSLGDTGNDTINISPTGTSTFGSGLNIRTGCFSINDVCVTGSGSGVSGGTAGMLTSWVNSTTLTATGTPTATAYVATSTTATSTFAGKMSIGTSTKNLNSSNLKTLYVEGLANNYNVSSAGILQINTPGDNDSPGTSDFSANRGLFFGIDTNTVSNAGSGFIQYYGGTGVNPARNLALNPNGGGVVLNGIFGETSTSFPVSIVGNTSANALVKIQNISTAGGTLTTPYAGFTFQTYNTVNTYEKGGIIVQDMEGGSCCYLRQKMRFLLNPTASNANVQDTVEGSTIMTLAYKNGYGTVSNLTNPVVGIGSTTPYAKLSVHALSNEGNSTLFAIASSTPTATTTHFVVNADGNTGIGTSSPYSKLSVAGQVVASNYLATTSSSNLGYSWANDPDTGISNFSANQIAFYNGGFQTWYIDSAGVIRGNISNAGIVSQSDVIVSNSTGKIGVSTTTPFGKLSATGTEGDSSLPVLLIASSTDNPIFSVNGAGHIRTGGGTPTVSTCGTSPSISGNDTAGTVTVGSGVVTACTITFAKTRSNTPRVVGVVTGGGLNIAGGYSAKSTSAITFSFAATVGSGTFDYYIVE